MKIAINGLGRIGRSFLRMVAEYSEVEISAVNDLGDIQNLAYLLKYDSAQGRSPLDIRFEDEGDVKHLCVGNKRMRFLSEKDPKDLPWKDFDIDVVLEATGFFTKYEDAQKHIEAGAKRVVISAPAKGEPTADYGGATILMGINEDRFEGNQITSNASCTTNSSSPMIQILHEAIGIEKAMLNTVHGYTATQSIVDAPSRGDYRKGRAGAHNIIPSSTGAAVAVTEAIPDLVGKFDGIAMRVPVIVGSLADVTFVSARATSIEEVNDILRKAGEDPRWKKVFMATDELLVSSDIIGTRYASIADLTMTRVVDKNLVKVCAWYDNETGYTSALLEHILTAGRKIR